MPEPLADAELQNNPLKLDTEVATTTDAVSSAAREVRTILEETAMELDRRARRYAYHMGKKVADPQAEAFAESARLIRGLYE